MFVFTDLKDMKGRLVATSSYSSKVTPADVENGQDFGILSVEPSNITHFEQLTEKVNLGFEFLYLLYSYFVDSKKFHKRPSLLGWCYVLIFYQYLFLIF